MTSKDLYKTIKLDEVNRLKSLLDSLRPLDPENQIRLDEKFRLEFNYNSNHLEGNTLTYGQTVMVLKFGKITGDVELSDVNEMKAHDAALKLVYQLAIDTERPLSESFLKELNEIILVEPFWKDAITAEGNPTKKKIQIGTYKSTPNSVLLKNGEMFHYASPSETPSKMTDLMNWYRENLNVLHPVHLAAEFHYRFVRIHPFDDGNGRVARLVMNYILQKFDYPTVIIKSADKDAYLTVLQKADSGDLKALLEYVEAQLIWSLGICIKAGKGEDITEDEDLNKEIELLKREKLTDGVIHKTPRIVQKLILDVENDFWQKIVNQQLKFSDFFTELEYNSKVDGERISQSVSKSSLEVGEIKQIHWEILMLGLLQSEKRVDYSLSLSTRFMDSEYEIRIVLVQTKLRLDMTLKDDEILFNDKRPYNKFYYDEEIKDIAKLISKRMLHIIKNA